ncbi:phosphorylase family protein, partial [Brevibacterium paucivorans]
DPELKDGVYAQFPGPHYETPAEVRMARTLGADLVGMSTALEAIAARAAGLEVVGISLVTNLGAGVSATPLSHAACNRRHHRGLPGPFAVRHGRSARRNRAG